MTMKLKVAPFVLAVIALIVPSSVVGQQRDATQVNLVPTNGSIDADVTLGRSADGVFEACSAGNTNNECVRWDLEGTANQIDVSSPTGVTFLDFGTLDLVGYALVSHPVLTSTADARLTGEVNLGALTTGALISTVGGGTATLATFVPSATCAGMGAVVDFDASLVKTCGSIDLTADVVGTLPTAQGGTGVSDGASIDGPIPFYNDGGAFADAYLFDAVNFVWDDVNDRLGIGTATPASTLHAREGASSSGLSANYDTLYIESGASAGLTIGSPSANASGMFFADPGSSIAGGLLYTHTGDTLSVYASAGEKMTVKGPTGFVGMGETAPAMELQITGATAPTLYIESSTATDGGRIILEDTDGAGCTSLQVLNGTPTYATITCP